MKYRTCLFGLLLASTACSSVDAISAGGEPMPASTSSTISSGATTMQKLAERFPGAVLLDEAEFTKAIQGHQFSYREVGGELTIERPKEAFLEGGRYELRGLRSISHGSYSIDHGIVSIECPESFLGLSSERVFFRHEGRFLMTNATGEGSVIELI
jgi:hypothetical protein